MSFARVHAFHFPKQSFSRAVRMDRWSGFCVRKVPRIWENLVKAIVVAPCPPNLRADPTFKVHCHPRCRQIGFLLPLTITTTLLWPRGCRLFLLSAMMSSACPKPTIPQDTAHISCSSWSFLWSPPPFSQTLHRLDASCTTHYLCLTGIWTICSWLSRL